MDNNTHNKASFLLDSISQNISQIIKNYNEIIEGKNLLISELVAANQLLKLQIESMKEGKNEKKQ